MHRRSIVIALIVLAIVAAAAIVAYDRLRPGRSTLPSQYYQAQKSSQSASVPRLDHVVIIVEENKPRSAIIGNPKASFINNLASTYATATNYYAVTNPSLPNYIALTSGTTAGITSDCNPTPGSCRPAVLNIADRLEAAHVTWKLYGESMPAPCYAANSGGYAVRHDPFVYYRDIASDPARCAAHVVPFTELASDLKTTASLPNYAFISPNVCNDMHDCDVAAGDKWLANTVPKILNAAAFTAQHSLLVIVWDEGDTSNNNVAVIFAGPAARSHYVSNHYYSHYSLLHTIEQSWHISPLTQNDRLAPLMTDMLR